MTISLTCQHCGARFEAKRSDAKFHSARCRQAHFRKMQDPVANPSPVATRKTRKTRDGSRYHTPTEYLDRFIESFGGRSAELRREAVRSHNVPAAVAEVPDEKLADWDRSLTSEIRLLSKIRQAVRAEQSSRVGT